MPVPMSVHMTVHTTVHSAAVHMDLGQAAAAAVPMHVDLLKLDLDNGNELITIEAITI